MTTARKHWKHKLSSCWIFLRLFRSFHFILSHTKCFFLSFHSPVHRAQTTLSSDEWKIHSRTCYLLFVCGECIFFRRSLLLNKQSQAICNHCAHIDFRLHIWTFLTLISTCFFSSSFLLRRYAIKHTAMALDCVSVCFISISLFDIFHFVCELNRSFIRCRCFQFCLCEIENAKRKIERKTKWKNRREQIQLK